MALTFELVTPERAVLSTSAWMVELPGSDGDLGVLENHAPVMSTIRDGEVRIWSAAGTLAQRIAVEGGFAEIDERGVTVLAERATLVA